jgi:hypothetical protein
MPKTGEEGPDHAERLAANADILKEGWEGTLEDMHTVSEEYENKGWDVVEIAADHTAPKSIDVDSEERFGLIHVIPGNKADEFSDAFENGDFPTYDVFRADVNSGVFLVTALFDPESEIAIFIAGWYEKYNIRQLVETAKDRGEMYTHVQTLDETVLGSFRHDTPEKFFPQIDK